MTLPRPVDVTLNDLGLIASGAFAVSNGIGPRDIKDTLLTYDNSTPGVNKATSGIYYYFNGGWRASGSDGTVDYGNMITIPYGTGFTIRKNPVTNGATSFLQNTRTY